MKNKTRTNSSPLDTKSNIFFTAAKLFTEKGYNRVSIREICDAVGVKKPTLYYYFKDKESLFEELIDEAKRLGEELAEEYIYPMEEWMDKLHGFLKLHVAYLAKYPTLVRFFALATFMSLPENLAEKVRPDEDEGMMFLKEVLTEGQEKGFLGSEIDVDLLAITMLGSIRYWVIYDTKTSSPDFKLDQVFENLFQFWQTHFFQVVKKTRLKNPKKM